MSPSGEGLGDPMPWPHPVPGPRLVPTRWRPGRTAFPVVGTCWVPGLAHPQLGLVRVESAPWLVTRRAVGGRL